MLMARSGKECLALKEDRKALVVVVQGAEGHPPLHLCVRLQLVLCLGYSALSLVTPRHFPPAPPFCQASWVHHCDST